MKIDFASDPPAPLDKGGADRRGIPLPPLIRGDLTTFNTYLLKYLSKID
ncbi:hypothetical protein VL20_6160 [Microcystis panniformis FACHB-1757]|uniref:Uncharacterized protein n=1 Tax=Microcystis panniformis FACHB-1757 TaxID=1638788 RepID=A0A0K1S9W7_9CHRO|nr:hypothetical protein VL20_6160 [Microcystis panniformis FACHB-1757]